MKLILLAAVLFYCSNVINAQSGAYDPTFGTNGVAKTDMGALFKFDASARQVLLNPDGSMYIILNATSISKRLSNGLLDSTYGLNGYTVTIPFTEAYATLQPDGKVVIVGNTSDNSFSAARFNLDGSHDTAFGTKGIQKTSFPGPSIARSVAVQNDGKIVVAGYVTDLMNNTFFTVVRYNTNSSPDETFNGSGKLLTDFPYKVLSDNGVDSVEIHSSYANSVVLQDDGKIVVGGYVFTGTDNDFAVARYNIDGSIDSSFNNDGKQTTDIGSRKNDVGYSLGIQPDGKILLGGYTSAGSVNNFAVARYDSNGSLDDSFNGTGKQTSNLGSDMLIGNSLAIQNDGKIVIAGYTPNGSINDFAVARFNTDGTADDSFGNNGTLTTDFSSSDDYAGSVAIQADNKIVVAGYSYIYSRDNLQQIAVSRYNPDGSLDNSFAGNGKLEGESKQGYTRFNSTFVQPNGKVVVAGLTWNGTNYDYAVARYNSNGSLDNTFSDDGKQITDLGGADEASSVVVQEDGKIIVAGTSDHRFALARYNVNGSPDNSFNGNGLLIFAVGIGDLCQSLALQPDGKIVVAGDTFIDSNYDAAYFAVVRLNANGTLDNSFGSNGKQLTFFDSSSSFGAAVAIQTDGKIVVGGRAYIENQNNFALARYNTNGTLDLTFSEDGKQNNVFTGDGYTGLSLAIQNDGKILLAGFAEDFTGTISSFAVARYKTNGDVDNTFGNGGYQLTSLGTLTTYGRSLAINYDGRIAVAGTNGNASIVLYKSDGTPDSTFGTNGILISNIGLSTSSIQSIVFSNNKLYAAGSALFPGRLGVVVRYLLAEGGPLAVSLMDFNATAQNRTVQLQWQVASEQDLSGFMIERGTDGNNFNSIGFVSSIGNSNSKANYATLDHAPMQGINFYRLKMIDVDGTFSYSKIVSVNIDAIFTLRLSPNPAKDILYVRSGRNEAVTIQITDAVGRTLRKVKVTLVANTPTPIYINNLPAGIYNIQLHTKTTTETSRFMKK